MIKLNKKLKAIRTKDSGCLNVISIMLNMPCGFLWSAYGLEINEFVVFLPNFIEFVLVFIQALLLGILPHKSKDSENILLNSKLPLPVVKIN